MGSASAAHQHVANLKRKGFLRRLPHQSRAVTIYQETEEIKEIPLVGRIALGAPIEELLDQTSITVPKFLLSGAGNHYALEAKGDSMNEDGILNGDILLINQCSLADNGDTVVAQIPGYKATLKRFYNHGNQVELRPKSRSSTHKSMFFAYGEIEIQGKFCGLMRRGI
jgi:repressor LexA